MIVYILRILHIGHEFPTYFQFVIANLLRIHTSNEWNQSNFSHHCQIINAIIKISWHFLYNLHSNLFRAIKIVKMVYVHVYIFFLIVYIHCVHILYRRYMSFVPVNETKVNDSQESRVGFQFTFDSSRK